MASIIINGKSIAVTDGCSVQIFNGTVKINGQNVTPDGKDIRIEIQGNVERLDVDSCSQIAVTGAVGGLTTISGDVKCGDVSGDVKTTSGDVRCNDVSGSVQTVSGDVEATRISGSVHTVSGDIN